MTMLQCAVRVLIVAVLLLGLLLPAAGVAVAADFPDFSQSDCGCLDIGMGQVSAKVNKTNNYIFLECLCGAEEGSMENYIKLSLFYYVKPEEAQAEFTNSVSVFKKAANETKQAQSGDRIVAESSQADRYGSLRYTAKKPWSEAFYWGELVLIRKSNYMGYVHLSGPKMDEARATTLFGLAEARLVAMIDGKSPKDGVLTIEHFDPITTPKDAEIPGGTLLATLKSKKNGRGISGKEVFFFKKDYTPEDLAFNGSLHFPETDPLFIDKDSLYQLSRGNIAKDFAVDSTDAAMWDKLGEATYNYLPGIDYGKLLPALKRHGTVIGTVYAVVFDKSPLQEYADGSLAKIEYIESIPIQFKGVAAITSRGVVNSSKNTILKIGTGPTEKLVTWSFPHYLLEDAIYFNGNTIFTVKWLSGLSMTFKVKEGFLADGEFEYIVINYKDAGWYRWFDQTFGNTLVECTVGLAPTGIGMAVGGTAGMFIGGPISLGVGGVILLYEGGQEYFDPLIVELHSQVLIDLDESPEVYTIEGMAKLYNEEGSTVEVKEGQTVAITDGEFGDVTGFDEGDLNEDLAYISGEIPSVNEPPGKPADEPSTIGDDSDDGINLIYVIVPVVLICSVVPFLALIIVLRRRRAQPLPVSPVPPPVKAELPPVAATEPGSCPKCGAASGPGARFCPGCGSSLEVSMKRSPGAGAQQGYCPKCGAPNAIGSSFCGKCGSKLGG